MELRLTDSSLEADLLPLCQSLKPGQVCLLYGDLGAGKTTIVRTIAAHFGYKNGNSPTFTLVNTYPSIPPIYHLDLYRLQGEESLYSMDIERYLDCPDSLVFIEWPERLETLVPENAQHWVIETLSETERLLTIKPELNPTP